MTSNISIKVQNQTLEKDNFCKIPKLILEVNTALFLFSDHGERIGIDMLSEQGSLEEMLPFFSVYLPKEFKRNSIDKAEKS
ncbi:hypothetical protein BpHYR1_038588 [Brachionus plicatilis]|uniref:Uncharacterized protein n=1 Tax=Brachionus plicatilis TaxID=10195 RepID=A0A3M7R616_BRAPC|nr:hypothetical protein BpHYR1_038588 [Brachionus plicatilis]